MITFHFENIGPVKSADLALGDLTIIVGRNNTGKTYLSYALYGFLKSWPTWPDAVAYFQEASYRALRREHPSLPDTKDIARSLRENGTSVHPIHATAVAAAQNQLLAALCDSFSAELFPSVFSSSTDQFSNARLTATASRSPDPRATGVEFENNRLSVDYRDGHLVCEWRSRGVPGDTLLTTIVALGLFRFLMPIPHSPFALSAERFGIALFFRELDSAKNQLVDQLQKLATNGDDAQGFPYVLIDKRASRYALAIKDNIEFTRGIPELKPRLGPLARDSRAFNDIKDMMAAYYRADGSGIMLKSKARGERAFEIPLYLASSSARGLSDFYFFLKHVATRDHLLIIDEPESHLDTANQILMARFLGRLVSLGVKVLVTTHSDYLLKELNNLIMLSNVDDDDLLRRLKYKRSDALELRSIKAYTAIDGTLRKAKIDNFGLDLPVFDETIHSINNASNSLTFALERKGLR